MRHFLLLMPLLWAAATTAQPDNRSVILHQATSADGRYAAIEAYGMPLQVVDHRDGRAVDIGYGSRPVWDEDGRLHFMSIEEGEDHSETIHYHVYDPSTRERSLLPHGAPRPEFVPPPTPAPTRTKREVPAGASVTGLSDWTIFLDQGHSQTENQGLYGYSEAQKTLRVGLHLRQMLLEQTDIAAVHVARTTDNDLVSLTQRTDLANSLGAHFYYSIHSDAGAPTANSTLMLWGANSQGVEKWPQGGKRMGDIMIEDLTAAMRIGTRGSRADSPFYGATNRTVPYLHVNRASNMASVLSEAGFHTNPTQQQRNLNADWKKLEAQSAFWSILRFHGASRPKVGILTGILTDIESGRPLNGATITIGDRTYTTDTYESLFRFHSDNPDELANGFYYMEGLVPGGTIEVRLAAPGYYPQTHTVSLQDTTFTFFDRGLISSVPPSVSTFRAPDLQDARIRIRFSRPMRRDSTEAAVSITPSVPFTIEWIDDLTMALVTESLTPDTEYTVRIGTSAEDRYQHPITVPYQTTFRTAPPDATPPQITAMRPVNGSTGVIQRPIITFEFDERLDAAGISDRSIEVSQYQTDVGFEVPGTVRYVERGNRSVLQFFPSEDLFGNAAIIATTAFDLTDLAGNRIAAVGYTGFYTHQSQRTHTMLASFEGSGIDSWWAPQQSGSTTGIVTEITGRVADDAIVNPLFGSARSMRLNYGFMANGSGLIRLYVGGASASANPRFTSAGLLEAHIHGDGSGTLFRFMVRDANGHLEGSPWIVIDWLGWNRVQWDMRPGQAVAWAGNANGILDGTLYTDSFQLAPSMTSTLSGDIRIDDYRFTTIVSETSVEEDVGSVERLELMGAYPNPFNPSTVIGYRTSGAHGGTPVRLAVYDVIGREVAVLVNGRMPAGNHRVAFDGSGLASGVYIIRLTASGEVRTGRMLLLK